MESNEPNAEARNVRIIMFNEADVPKVLPCPGTTILMSPAQAPADREKASLMTKAQRFKGEMATAAKAGFPMTSRAGRKARRAICNACPYFNRKGNWGLGACEAPGCGCTRAKLWFATAVCPKGLWPAEVVLKPKTP
jgi:hypothetical protein